MSIYYTCEENTLILISLLKQHGIKYIIASPGATNVSLVASVQNDPFFTVFSAVDERAAAFMACGLAEELNESVVLSCTGATASRNYIPGLTEAFRKHLPILAVTASQNFGKTYHYSPQQIDRTCQSENVVKLSVQISAVITDEDKENTITSLNNAILELNHREKGPVHINLVTLYSNDFSVKELPDYRVIRRITVGQKFPNIESNCKIGIFVGIHEVFDEKTEDAIERFCDNKNAIVLCDQTSNYRGKHRVLANLLNEQDRDFYSNSFDLVIHIGYVSGAYIKFNANQIWRVNPDGQIRDLYKRLTYVFEMTEQEFFDYYAIEKGKSNQTGIQICNEERKVLLSKIPELPFSNIWIASRTSMRFPENSVLHLGILNSLRTYNYFETPKYVSCFSNTGGFGIDGCVSSMIGAALASPNKEVYGVVGDLAFFYDQNSIICNLPSNIHLMVVNNGMGTEFKNYNHRCAYLGESANDYIAAKGHNGFKSTSLMKDYVEALGIRYLSASNKTQYLEVMNEWLVPSSTPVILEVFTTDKDESDALKLMNTLASDKKRNIKKNIGQLLRTSGLMRVIKKLR